MSEWALRSVPLRKPNLTFRRRARRQLNLRRIGVRNLI
jgi:hypothetical protein